MKNYILYTGCFLVLLSGCCREEEMDELLAVSVLPLTTLEAAYGCDDTRYDLQLDASETYTIIRSQAAFEAEVEGNCMPQIDFSIYDLVIGRKGLTSGNASISYQLEQNSGNPDVLTLTVTFNQDLTTVAPTVTYHALIPKLGDEQTVFVKFSCNGNSCML